ncbi:MAG: DUF4126 domain-containing protein [Bacteroidia bacterium]|nr:DUF4126 domain-containing protein [Bacteroidia bacterium]
MQDYGGLFFSLCLGLGLSASSGFRIFVPMLVAAIAAKVGVIPLAENMAWMGSWTAIIILGTATLGEIVAYYFPWFDHILDVIASPSALIAGTVLTASVLTGMDPAWQWGLGLIVGGGSAGLTQASTVTLRAGSTATTGGIGNPLVATFEHFAAIIGSVLSVWLTYIAVFLFGIFFLVIVYFILRRKKGATPGA